MNVLKYPFSKFGYVLPLNINNIEKIGSFFTGKKKSNRIAVDNSNDKNENQQNEIAMHNFQNLPIYIPDQNQSNNYRKGIISSHDENTEVIDLDSKQQKKGNIKVRAKILDEDDVSSFDAT